MMFARHVVSTLATLLAFTAADIPGQNTSTSSQILPDNFKPPQVFRNINLVRNINLEKVYPRETINVVIENIDSQPQQEYYIPFDASVVPRVGSFEAKDKKDRDGVFFVVEPVAFDTSSSTQFYRIVLPEPLAPKAQQTISYTYSILSAYTPLPASIEQNDKQYVVHAFSAYTPSAYTTVNQKTKLKFGSADVPDFTKLPGGKNSDGVTSENKEDPLVQGTTFTYGPFSEVPPGAMQPVSVRFEFTKPLNHVDLLERDIEVSHWGGNLATEERYMLLNRAAGLKNHFSRLEWQRSAYYSPPTSALKELKFPLLAQSADPYFIDDIGNVSTSHFRSNTREAMLELRPRYPVFGDWRYKFKIGWNQDIRTSLRKLKAGDSYILKLPFLEGPRQTEGIEYDKVHLRIILPEGATNIKYETSVPLVGADQTLHKTFMDTVGRTTLHLTAMNLVDELRGRELIVTYDYPFSEGLRKPLTIIAATFSIFCIVWMLGQVDVRIGKK